MNPSAPWPFSEPPDAEAITLDRVLAGEAPILLAARDDDGWQFLDGEHVFEDDAAVVLLGEIVQFDASLLELADLPVGWHARRDGPDAAWVRREGEPK